MPVQESARQLESGVARFCAWAALLGAFVLSWQTWVGIGDIAEYGSVRYALPVCVDGYMVTVLMAWIMPVTEKARRFARWNVYLASGLSVITQSAYHGALVFADTHETLWKAVIAWMAGALPPLFAALSVHFRTAVRYEEPLTERPRTTGSLSVPAPIPGHREPTTTGPPTLLSPPPAVPPVKRAVSVPVPPRAVPGPPPTRAEPRIPPAAASSRRPGPARPGPGAEARKARAFAFFRGDPGMSSRRIAKETGVSDRTVRRWREEYDEMEKRRREAS